MLYEIIVLIVLIIATFTDYKKREVPDELSHGLMILALILRIIYSFMIHSFNPLIEGILGFGIFFGIGYLLYKVNQWGGGDAKILGGMGALFGFSLSNLYMVHFFINLMIVGAIYGIIYSIFLAYKNRNKIKYKKIKYLKQISVVYLVFFLIGFFIQDSKTKFLYFMIVIILYLAMFLIQFIGTLEKHVMQKKVTVSKLTEGDWIVNDVKVGKKVIAKAKENGLTLNQIKLIKKAKIKKVLIKEGIPFIPSFLIAFVLTYFYGSIILILVNLV